ncbi:MAG: Gfo/Idh/MocA family protein [Cellulomonadaceae bacterium]
MTSSPEPDHAPSPRRVAVIGCGDVSSVHFDALRSTDGVELVAVCDTDDRTLATAAARHGVPGFADHRDLLREVRPDAVHVCTPHDQHLAPAAAALAAGVHVVLEKPLAGTLTDAERLAAAARTSRSKVAVCLQNRYNETSRTAHHLVAGGTLGEIYGASASLMWSRIPGYYTDKPWRGERARAGGGVLINQAFHTIDLLLWLLGPVTGVEGRVSSRRFAAVSEVEDTADVVLRHASGAVSTLFATVANAVDSPVSIDIAAENAALHLRGDLTVAYPGDREERSSIDAATSSGRSYWGPSHAALIADFYASLELPGPFPIGPEQALAVQQVIAAVYAANA